MSKLSAGAAFHSLTSSHKNFNSLKTWSATKRLHFHFFSCLFPGFTWKFGLKLSSLTLLWRVHFSSSSSKGNKHGRWEVGKLTSAPIPTHFHRFYPRGTFKNICLSHGAAKKVGGWEGRQSLSKDGNHLKRSAAAAAATACGGAARPGRVTVERRSL